MVRCRGVAGAGRTCKPDGKHWTDKRVVVFTEYRDTQLRSALVDADEDALFSLADAAKTTEALNPTLTGGSIRQRIHDVAPAEL